MHFNDELPPTPIVISLIVDQWKINMKNFNKKYITEIGFLIGNKVRENFELRIRSIFLEEGE